VIIVDGKSISLGIPGQGKGAQKSSDRVPDIPLGRAGTADEAAKALIFLISPMASYVSYPSRPFPSLALFFYAVFFSHQWTKELIDGLFGVQ
jgi:hypothetical protein